VSIRVVIFDLDDTLFDHSGAAAVGLASWLGQLGREVTPDLAAAWAEAEATHFPGFLSGRISHAEQRRRRLRDFLPILGHPVGDDDALDALYAQGYLPAYQGAWRAYPDAAPALTELRAEGIRTGVLTNGATVQQTAKLAAIGLAELAGPIVTAEELGVAKPHAEAFATTCQRLGAAAHQVLYVGDNHTTDILGARAAGLAAVHLDRTGAGPLDEPARITTLGHLRGLLGG